MMKQCILAEQRQMTPLTIAGKVLAGSEGAV
jgi:hypothetical protein